MPPVYSKFVYTESGGKVRKYKKPRVLTYNRKQVPPKYTRAPRMLRNAPIGKSLGFPMQNVVQMRYCTYVNLFDSVGGILDLHAFRANGIYDPDVTGTGHQPLGRDEWLGSFYNHYKVISSKIKVEAMNTTVLAGGAYTPTVIGLYLSDDLTVPSAWTTLKESGRGSVRIQNPANTETTRLGAKFNQKFFKGQGVNQSQLGAAAGADPTEQAYFILWAQSADQLSTFSDRTFMVTIDYMVQLSEPKDLNAS